MVFLFLYGLVRVLPFSLFHRMAGPCLHVFIRFGHRDHTRRMVRYLDCLIGKYPDQWNWLTVPLNRHHLDLTCDMNVTDSSNLDPLPAEKKRMQRVKKVKLPILCLASIDGKKD